MRGPRNVSDYILLAVVVIVVLYALRKIIEH